MQKENYCLYCGYSNNNPRYCTNCFAKLTRPRIAKESSIPVVQPGTIVGGLFRLSEEVISGNLPADRFETQIAVVKENVQKAFESIYTELGNFPQEIEDTEGVYEEYRNYITQLLDNVQFMLKTSLEEMALYGKDNDFSHIRIGRMMAQRAELEYIDFLEAVKADAEGNPFEGEANVLSDLAARFIKAQIGINEFKESLSQLEKTVNTYIEKANEFLKAGFEKAYQFDGTDDTLVFEAIEDLQTSSEFLGKAVVNLYNPQEVRRVVEELVGETVERMEMEKELGIEEE